MVDWANLRCAYGSGEFIPELLRRAEATGSDVGEEWTDLWSRICHQGTVYSASYAAVPLLTAMCLSREPSGYMAPLHLVASILASNDAPQGAGLLHDRHVAHAGQVRAIAERCVELAADDVEFIYGLETLAAFEGRGVWSRNLSFVADGEVPLDCISCGENLLVHIEGLPATVTCWDASRERTTVVPAGDLTPSEERLISLATANNRPNVGAKLLHLFGSVTCPECGSAFSIAAALA